jgi:hypothetical protein
MRNKYDNSLHFTFFCKKRFDPGLSVNDFSGARSPKAGNERICVCLKAVRAAADLLRGAERSGANTRGRDLTRAVQASQHLPKL